MTTAIAGTFSTIEVQSEHFILQLELYTGSMENPDDEQEEIEKWKRMYTPILEDLAAVLRECHRELPDGYKGVILVEYDEALPALWEESISSSDIPAVLEKGN